MKTPLVAGLALALGVSTAALAAPAQPDIRTLAVGQASPAATGSPEHDRRRLGGADRFQIFVIGPGVVSGRFDRTATFRYGVLGTRDGNRMRLAILRRVKE